jgi:hypothetical protein
MQTRIDAEPSNADDHRKHEDLFRDSIGFLGSLRLGKQFRSKSEGHEDEAGQGRKIDKMSVKTS